MTREEIIKHLERHRTEFANDHGWNARVLEALDTAIKVLKQEYCEDTISRRELLKAIDTYDKFGYWGYGLIPLVSEDGIKLVPYIHYDDVIRCIESMPSVLLAGQKMESEDKE